MAGNPRIDDLRKRIERDPQSRLFAQLAEELRKDGDLADAIAVARTGLEKHPNYPSARMTLGRALLDTGDTRGAQRELEAAVQGAPDNILAGRLLAECLEAEGQLEDALTRYRTTLGLSVGDKQIAARVEALEQRIRSRAAGAAPAPVGSSHAPTALDADHDLFEAADADDLPPIPLVEVSEEFELERPYDALAAREQALADAVPELMQAEPVPSVSTPELDSSTMAELYFNQGFTDQAIEVYRRMAQREPGNPRVEARLRELTALHRHLEAEAEPAAVPVHPTPSPAPDPTAARRLVLERTIARLEDFQAALSKGVGAWAVSRKR
ncbi:MAG: tetratricopeptide repeat protein [Vicinamibacteria bacterium]